MQRNVLIYGRFERRRKARATWTFSGLDGVDEATTVADAVTVLNGAGYEIVAVTESGSPGDRMAWSNMYIFGRAIEQ